jgi:hypothetical protein
MQNAKLRELVHPDLFDYADIEPQLAGFDACFFCLGVASSGIAKLTTTTLPTNLRWPPRKIWCV